MVIHNEIFESYRIKMKQKVKDIEKSADVLMRYGYTVIDPDGEVLNKENNEKKEDLPNKEEEELSSNNE